MTSTSKPQILHPAVPLLPGLITAQIIATIQVYLSDLNLHASLAIIEKSGYLPVPNHNIMPGLKDFVPALCGGFFFTLSIGAGLALLAAAAAWTWVRLFLRNRQVLVFLALLWAASVLLINIRGLNIWGTLYFSLVPLSVFKTCIRLLPEPGQRRSSLRALAHVLPVILLMILWTTQYDRNLFLDLRDHLLLSNPVGKKVSDFYYKYSPFAAEAFKSINQKTLKTCRLPQTSGQMPARSLGSALLALDYLPVDTEAPVDLEIAQVDDQLLLRHNSRVVVETTVRDLLADPNQILNQFSLETDRFAMFRQFTFFAIVLGYPLTLYILMHALIWAIIRNFTDGRKAAAIASTICLFASLIIFIAFLNSRSSAIDKHNLAHNLNSESWQQRVAALRFIATQGLEIGRYHEYLKSLSSHKVAERYWAAKAMARSKMTETYDALISLINDSNVNVESMAFLALARRGDTRALPKILDALKSSDRWYSQIYAYHALRTLGWKQSRSH